MTYIFFLQNRPSVQCELFSFSHLTQTLDDKRYMTGALYDNKSMLKVDMICETVVRVCSGVKCIISISAFMHTYAYHALA